MAPHHGTGLGPHMTTATAQGRFAGSRPGL